MKDERTLAEAVTDLEDAIETMKWAVLRAYVSTKPGRAYLHLIRWLAGKMRP